MLAETERRKGNRIPSRCTRFGLLYSDVVKFSEQIGRYFDVFEKENIHIVFYDDLVANTGVVYRDILEFLGVDPTFQPEFEIINRNKRIRSRGIRWLLRSIAFMSPLRTVVRTLVPKKMVPGFGLSCQEIQHHPVRPAAPPAQRA